MKSKLNFIVKKTDGEIYDMHELGVWVSSFHIYSPNIGRNKISVPGMAGAYLGSTQEQERKIDIEMQIEADDMKEYDDKKHILFNLFYSEEKLTIVRDLTPEKEVYAVQEGEYDIDDITCSDGEFSVSLTMLDPYVYGKEQTESFTSDILTLPYKGTAPASPIFELEVKEPVTFAMIQNQLNEYMMVGKPFDLNQIPTEKYPRLLRENGSDLTGWTYLPGGEFLDDGILGGMAGGSIKSNGYAFYADKFGDNPNGWVGPAIRRSFSESKQDFKITADLESLNKDGGVGKIVVALLDTDDNIVASMGIMDPTNAYDNNKVYFRVGGRQTIHEEGGAVYKVYNNSRVYLEMTRVGKNFNVRSYERLEDGTLTSRSRNKFVDDLNRYQAPIQQAVIYIAKAKTYRTFPMYMHGLSVFGINDTSQDQIPYIAYKGDIIRFDTRNYSVYINGVPFKEELAIGSTFFDLYKGDNQLIASPQEAFNTKIIYRDTHR